MKQGRQTKRTLVLSVLSVVLCLVMLVGTTFAWFTDTASASVKDIQSGKLDVALEYFDGADWVSAEGKTLDFVKAADAPADEAILWEPGCTYALPQLRVVNNGNLALKYKLTITGIQGSAKLNEAIDWTITLGGTDYAAGTEHSLLPKAADELTLKGHMQETAGNEYQDLAITGITIAVSATQDTVEYDSNGNQYDKNASYPTVVSEGAGANDAGSGDSNTKNAFEEAVTEDAENLVINLASDVMYDLNGYTLPMGGASTKAITINGNGHTITFNKLNSDCSSVMLGANVEKLVINNAVLTSTGNDQTGTWNVRDIVFTGNVELNHVTSNRGLAFASGKKAVLKDVTINETDAPADTYAMWIEAGADVEIDGLTINAKSASGHSNRGIAIKDQFITNPAETKLSVKNATFKSNKKAAILVTSKGGATIILDNVTISEVAADTVNPVWVDKSYNNPDKVTVSGGSVIVEP